MASTSDSTRHSTGSIISPAKKTLIHQHQWHGLDNFNIGLLQSADAVCMLLSRLDFGLGNDICIAAYSHIFATLYYRAIVKYIQFLSTYLPFHAHLEFEPVHVGDSDSCGMYQELNSGDWWWDTQDHLSTGVMIVPVTCASDKTNLTNVSDNQDAWSLCLAFGNIRKNIQSTPHRHAWILVGLISCSPICTKISDEVWHSVV